MLLTALAVTTWSEAICMGASWLPASLQWPMTLLGEQLALPAFIRSPLFARAAHAAVGGVMLAACAALAIACERAVWHFAVGLFTGKRAAPAKA